MLRRSIISLQDFWVACWHMYQCLWTKWFSSCWTSGPCQHCYIPCQVKLSLHLKWGKGVGMPYFFHSRNLAVRFWRLLATISKKTIIPNFHHDQTCDWNCCGFFYKLEFTLHLVQGGCGYVISSIPEFVIHYSNRDWLLRFTCKDVSEACA